MNKLTLGEDIKNNIRKYISVINTEILLTSKQFTTYELLKSQIEKQKVENKDDSEMSNIVGVENSNPQNVGYTDDSETNNIKGVENSNPQNVVREDNIINQSGGTLQEYIINIGNDQRNILRLPYQYGNNNQEQQQQQEPNTYINKTSIPGTQAQAPAPVQNILQNLNEFIKSDISANIINRTNIPDYIRYMYENYLDSIKDFTTNNVQIQEIFKIFTETNRKTAECPNNSLNNDVFNARSIIKNKYIDIFMRTLLDNPDINLNSSEQKKLFAILKLFKPNCVGFCGNFSNNWFTNQFINWDQELWNEQNAHTFIDQANHFRDIIVIENSEGYDLTTLMLKYLKDEYDLFPPDQGHGAYTINLIKFINPTTLIDSESTKSIKPDEIVIGQAQLNTERGIISSLNFYNINVNSIVGDNFNERLNTFWDIAKSDKDFFKVTDTLYLRNVYDYNINVGDSQCNLSDIYSSYFDFIKTFYDTVTMLTNYTPVLTNYTPKFHFRLAKLTDISGNNTKYRILLTIEVKFNNDHRRVSFVLNNFGNKSSIETYITDLDDMMIENQNDVGLIPNIYPDDTPIPATNYTNVPFSNDINFTDINFTDFIPQQQAINENLFIPLFGPNQPNQNQVYENDTLLKINYGIILTRIFGQINNDNRNYMKRLLYTFKLIGDQGQIRFARLLKEHIQIHNNLKSEYSVLYTSKDYPSHIYAGLLGQESLHTNGYYFGDETGTDFKFQDKLRYYKGKLRESSLPQITVNIGPLGPPPPGPAQQQQPAQQSAQQSVQQPTSSILPSSILKKSIKKNNNTVQPQPKKNKKGKKIKI